MLVIHPKDKTTAMLSALYDGLEAQVVADYRTTKEMGHLLHHVSTQERIMLVGHGSALRTIAPQIPYFMQPTVHWLRLDMNSISILSMRLSIN